MKTLSNLFGILALGLSLTGLVSCDPGNPAIPAEFCSPVAAQAQNLCENDGLPQEDCAEDAAQMEAGCESELSAPEAACANESLTSLNSCLEGGGEREDCIEEAAEIGRECIDEAVRQASLAASSAASDLTRDCLDEATLPRAECIELGEAEMRAGISTSTSPCQRSCLETAVDAATECEDSSYECLRGAITEVQDCTRACTDREENVAAQLEPQTITLSLGELEMEMTFTDVTEGGLAWTHEEDGQNVPGGGGDFILELDNWSQSVHSSAESRDPVFLKVERLIDEILNLEELPKYKLAQVDQAAQIVRVFEVESAEVVDGDDGTEIVEFTFTLPPDELTSNFIYRFGLERQPPLVQDDFPGQVGGNGRFGLTTFTEVNGWHHIRQAYDQTVDQAETGEVTDVPLVNHHDPDLPGGGTEMDWFSFSDPFPGLQPGVEDDSFTYTYQGALHIPPEDAGFRTFIFDSDDQLTFRIPGLLPFRVSEHAEVWGGDTIVDPEPGCSDEIWVAYNIPPGNYLVQLFGASSTGEGFATLEVGPLTAFRRGSSAQYLPCNLELPETLPVLPHVNFQQWSLQVWEPRDGAEITSYSQVETLFADPDNQLDPRGDVELVSVIDWREGDACQGIEVPAALADGLDDFIVTSSANVVFRLAGRYRFHLACDEGGAIAIEGASNIEIIASDGDLATVEGDTVRIEGPTENSRIVFEADIPAGERFVEIVTYDGEGPAFARLRVTSLDGTRGTHLGAFDTGLREELLLGFPPGTLVEPGVGGVVTDAAGEASLEIGPAAITEPVEIRIDPVPFISRDFYALANGDIYAVAALHEYSPDGFQFQEPVSLSVVADTSSLTAAQVGAASIARFLPDNIIELLPTTMVSLGPGVHSFESSLLGFSSYGVVYPADRDGDGVFDAYDGVVDDCLDSDLGALVDLGNCTLPNTVDATGCSLADRQARGDDLSGLCPTGGGQTPGDCNQDGNLDLTDSICMLSHLFLGKPSVLPCEGGLSTSPANVALLDGNGDAVFDLSDALFTLGYLFGFCPAGPPCPPHVLGTSCVAIEGCPQVCAP